MLRRFAVGAVALAVFGGLALFGFDSWALRDLPLPPEKQTKPALLLDAAGGESLGRIGPLKLADVERGKFPNHLIQAVLSIEDRRFYRHFGVDLLGIARAAHRNAMAGEVVEGGSTITQQLVRMRYLDRERNFTRKMREAVTAVWLERHLSKDEILASYLNTVYLGANAYGVPAAAQLYFSKQVSELTLAEAAMLAGIIRAPSQLNPLHDPQAAQARAAVVLDSMVANEVIDAETAAAAKRDMPAVRLSPELRRASTWFADWVAREATQLAGASSPSMRLHTTLDVRLQRLAEKTINEVLAARGARSRASQAALVALRPDGAVLAMVGGRDYATSQFNRAVEANRHPGSTFKLFVYLAALRNGYSPRDLIDAGPIEIRGWEPENFGGREYGRVTLADAFAHSINTAAVRLAMDVGLDKVISAARDLGIESRLSPVPSLALGAVEVSLLELTGAFASVRTGQLHRKPWGIAALGTEDQPLRVLGPPAEPSQTLGPYQQPLTQMLRLVVERGTGRAAALGGFAAGKTGTSQNHRDAWFVGFNESLVVGVWVGNDDGTPMKGVVGGTLPASIWKSFVTEASPLLEKSPQVARLPERSTLQQGARESRPPWLGTGAEPLTTEGRAQRSCSVEACARKYSSFNSPDCTYQPYRGGRRRLCEIDAEGGWTSQNLPGAEPPGDQHVAPSLRRADSFQPRQEDVWALDRGPPRGSRRRESRDVRIKEREFFRGREARGRPSPFGWGFW